MLEPGIIFCKIIGILALLGVGLFTLGCKFSAYITWGITAFIMLVLIVLLCVEQHQDKVLYKQARQENAELGDYKISL